MKKPGFQESLTPYESWISTTESLNPAAFFKALRRGVMLSAVLAMKSMGELVFATKGPTSRSTKSVPAKGRIELTGKSPFRLHLPPRTAHSEEDVDSTSSFIWRIRCSEYFSNSSTVSFIPLPSVHIMALNASSVPSSSVGSSGGVSWFTGVLYFVPWSWPLWPHCRGSLTTIPGYSYIPGYGYIF
jgi:hypothetical protein